MNAEAATLAVIDALEALGLPYMLVGSFASNYYGVPRSTQDVDFVVELAGKPMRAVVERLGPEFQLDPQVTFETITGTRRYVVRIAGTGFRIEFFLRSEDEHDGARFGRRCRAALLGRQVSLPTAEDVIITKLRWSRGGKRAKDVDDARNVMAVQGARIDWDYVASWCDRHGTRDLLESIRSSIPNE
jgi:hypothetical protein